MSAAAGAESDKAGAAARRGPDVAGISDMLVALSASQMRAWVGGCYSRRDKNPNAASGANRIIYNVKESW